MKYNVIGPVRDKHRVGYGESQRRKSVLKRHPGDLDIKDGWHFLDCLRGGILSKESSML